MKTRRFAILLVAMLFCALTVFAGCNQGFKVNFDDNYQGGSSVQVLTAEGKITPPSDPTREGYTFAGWYFDSACSDELKVNFATEDFTADTTLYAKWVQNPADGDGDGDGNGDVGAQSAWQTTDTHHWKLNQDGQKVDYATHNTNGPAGSCADCGYGGGMAAGVKVYYYDHNGWGSVKSYTWKNGNDIDSWPGNTMEAWDGHPGWFVAEIEAMAVNIIFNSGSNQTSDLVVANGPYFVGENGCATLEEALQAIANNDFANHGGSAGGGTTSGATAYLMGIGGDWSTGIAMTAQTGMDGNEEFVLLNQVVGETDAFKVKVGDTWIGYEKVENNANLNVRPEGDFANIKVPAGTYNIYYKPSTGTIYIEVAE